LTGETLTRIFREAVSLCDAEILLGAALVRDGNSLEVHKHSFATAQDAKGLPVPRLSGKGVALSLSLEGGAVGVIAAGKAAAGMARAVQAALGDRIRFGLMVIPEGMDPGRIPAGFEVMVASHPLPDFASVEAAKKALALAGSLKKDDLLVAAISGGTSALLAAPAEGLSLSDKMETTRVLLRSGADIGEINAVRKHLSRIKGGRLAAATQAAVLGLLFSDVAGDPPDVIGSGPVSPDPSTFADALTVLDRRRIREAVPPAVRAHLEAGASGQVEETPKPGSDLFSKVRTTVVAGPDHLRAASVSLVAAAGFQGAGTEPPSAGMEAGALAVAIGQTAKAARARLDAKGGTKPLAFVWVREPSVLVHGDGVGGRNGHLALAVAKEIAGVSGVTFLSAGSDGIDGATNAAGAVVDGESWRVAEERGLKPGVAIERFDSGPLHAALGSAIVTGRTGTNFMDLQILAVDPI
jgi:glycerate 2-kinase